MENELEKILKEAAVDWFNVLSYYLLRGAEEN
jgi:hypothetical protein